MRAKLAAPIRFDSGINKRSLHSAFPFCVAKQRLGGIEMISISAIKFF